MRLLEDVMLKRIHRGFRIAVNSCVLTISQDLFMPCESLKLADL